MAVIGGPASAPTGPGGNRLSLDGAVHTDGAVGVLLGPSWPLRTVVSQGCRPIGERYTVTRSERAMVQELAGQPAMARLSEVVAQLSPDERAVAAQSLYLGWLVDDHKLDLERGDFLVRPVHGADPDTGALSVPGDIDVGATVQFHVRDAASADEDLRWMVSDTPAAGALAFVGAARGIRMFGVADHDAEVLATSIDPPPLPGAVAGGAPDERGRHVHHRSARPGRHPILRPSPRGGGGAVGRSGAGNPFARVTLSCPASKRTRESP